MDNLKNCLQCGFKITKTNQPAGFCSLGCAEVHQYIHDKEFERAEDDMKGAN